MTDPNKPTRADLLEARERVKARNNPAHYSAIDNGDWDDFGAVQGALQDMFRERAGEEVEVGE